jgi:putative ABC transport system substrate-binding protein
MRSSRLARTFVALWLTVAAVVVDPAASGRPAIAIVKSSSLAQFDSALNAVVARLETDALQPEILTFDLGGNPANGSRVLDALRAAAPALIVTVGSLATTIILRDTSSVPIVFSMVLYPEQSGFDRARDRMTGASLDIPLDVQFRYLRRLLPAARRVGVLHHPGETGTVVRAAQTAAKREGLELVTRTVADPGAAVAELTGLMEEVDVIWTVADSHVVTAQTISPLILAAMRRRVPFIGLSAAHVRAGALAAMSCDYDDVGVQTAELALRVLAGEKPAAIRITTPRRVTLAINLRTAEHVGVAIAPDVAAEAAVRVP